MREDQIACARVDPDDGWEDCLEASLHDNIEAMSRNWYKRGREWVGVLNDN
jgi:hypothetical protein